MRLNSIIDLGLNAVMTQLRSDTRLNTLFNAITHAYTQHNGSVDDMIQDEELINVVLELFQPRNNSVSKMPEIVSVHAQIKCPACKERYMIANGINWSKVNDRNN